MASVTVTFNKADVVKRIKKASEKGQFIMAEQALKDANFYAKHDTGELIASSIKASDFKSGLLIWDVIYAKKQYYLKSAFKDKNPNAQMMWSHVAYANHGKEWKAILQKIIDKEV